MIRRIIQKPDGRLTQPSVPVDELSTTIKAIIADLVDTRISGHGAALAAVQIGEHVRIVAIDPNLFYGYSVLINPEIVSRGKQIVVSEEGCMSIAMGTMRFKVRRNEVVTVKFLDRNGAERTIIAKRLPAYIAQHEIDHLDGKMIA